MCGIAGLVRGALRRPSGAALGAREFDLSLGERMAERLRHRGPDAHGVALLPGGRGVFAHTRLSIIDLSPRGAQPYTSVDGVVTLSFNGEIYNYRDLRRDLERRGVSFRSTSDTEVILELYRTYGPSALTALDGMFAFAIFDAAADRVLLARDRLGKKPLYYSELPAGDLVFASEAKALFVHPDVPRAMAPEHLPEYLSYGYVGTPRSLFRGLRKLEPATRRTYRPDREPVNERFWSLDPIREQEPAPSFDDARVQVREAIGRAVERRLVADVPVGAFLSGGVDSAIVALEMVRRGAGPVRTFTAGFSDDSSFDERAQARALAARLGTVHTELDVRASGPEDFVRLLDYHDEPYGDSSAIALHAVSAATKPHVSVVLTGDGGDEVLAGYSRFLGGLVVGRAPVAVLEGARRWLARVPEPRGYKSPLSLARRFVEHAERTPDEQLLAWNAYFAGPTLARLLRPELRPADPWSVLAPQLELLAAARARGGDRLDQILRHNLATYLLDDLLVKADRMTMAVGLEARSPFLDRELVELCFSLPSRLKLRRGRLKALLREAYRGLLPDEVLDRKKHGFGVPVSRWWGGALREPLHDWLGGPDARVLAYLEPAAVQGLLAEHGSGRRDHGQRLFALLQLELWLRGLAA